MAVGDGGFKTAFQGFDKNEVNEYISNLRKKMSELETEMKDNDGKVKAAVKSADEAEDKIRHIEQASKEKIAELELQLKNERKSSEELLDQIDDLKRKVKHGGSSSGGASNAEVQRQAAEIIEKANKTARETVDAANKTAREVVAKAKATAGEIIANAQNTTASGGVPEIYLDEFMTALNNFIDDINRGYKNICEKAEGITSDNADAPAPSMSAVEIPDFSDIEAPEAEAPAAEAPEMPAFKEPEPETSFSFDDIQPQSTDDDDMTGGFGMFEEHAAEVKESDTADRGKASFDMDFDKELIAQTVPSSSLKDGVGEDLLEAVRKEEEKYAVQPTPEEGRKDFDMDTPAADDGIDAMNKLLEQAQAAFGGGGSLEFDTEPLSEPDSAPEPEPQKESGNPWEDLQKQLEAMEQSGNFGGGEADEAPAETYSQSAGIEDPQAPSADDSSIWDFSSMESGDSSDDDMSTDLFGNF